MLLTNLEYIGICIFAYNGVKLSLEYDNTNIYKAGFMGILSGIGGGTIRDFSYNKPFFWIKDKTFIILTILSAILGLKTNFDISD